MILPPLYFRCCLVLFLPALTGCARAQPEAASPAADVTIELAGGTEAEQQAETQLRRILTTYDTRPWTFTRAVRIEERVIPHSHPVLTLNTRYVPDDDIGQLATYLHEQLHWFVSERDAAREAVVAELRERYPDVPVGRPDGARDEESTYLHLIVCRLELDALSRLVGEAEARDLLAQSGHYRWIYARVLEDTDQIGALLSEHGLVILD